MSHSMMNITHVKISTDAHQPHCTYLPVWLWVLGSHQERCTQDRRPQPMVFALLGIKWYHHMRNDEVRRTTGQPRLSAIVQARRLSLFGHIARMPDKTDARSIITASSSKNWRRPPEIKQSLTGWGDNCSSESSTLETDFCVWLYAPLVVLATQ